MPPPTCATRVLKTKVVGWLCLMIQTSIQIGLATGSSPPDKGPWLLQWRLLLMAHMGISLSFAIHVLRRADSWTEAQRADWMLAGFMEVAPINNLVCFFLLPSFDVTRTTWPLLMVKHLLLCGLVLDLPPMHMLVQLCICLPAFGFLDFQKACSLARSSQQQLLLGCVPGSSCSQSFQPTAAQAALDNGRCPHGVATRYILHQGLPLLLVGVATVVIVCTFVQNNNREARRALPPKMTKGNRQGQAAGSAHQPEDPDSASPPAVPLESLGIYIISTLGLRPCFHWFHSCIIGLASRQQRIVLGSFCLPFCSYYAIRAIVSRYGSKPFHVSAEEVLVLIISSYVVGRDSSKLDMSGILQHIQSRLLASQALLVDMLPAHLVARMLNNMQDTEPQGQQGQEGGQEGQQQQQRQQRPGGRKTGGEGRQAPAAARGHLGSTSGQFMPKSGRRASTSGQHESTTEQRPSTSGQRVSGPGQRGSTSGQRVSAPGQRVRTSPTWRRRPARRASSLLLQRLVAARPMGPEAEAEAEAVAYPEPSESWAQGQEDAAPGPSIRVEPEFSRHASFSSCLGLAGLEQESWDWEGGGSSVNQAAAASGLPQAPRPADQAASLYTTLSRTLSSSIWTLPSQLASHALGLSALSPGAGGSRASVQSKAQEHPEALSGRTTAASHECVTLFFSDICGFSSWAGRLPPEMVMSTLDDLYSRLDNVILNEYPGLYKVETVGDAYIVAANLLTPDPDHAATAVHFALRAQQEAAKVLRPDRDDGMTLEMRIGLHSGSIMSGIVGKIRRRFCLFGNTMNMAARTESSCPKGSIQLTAATYTLAQPSLAEEVSVRERGAVQVKGSEEPLMMFLASASQPPQQGSLKPPDDQGTAANWRRGEPQPLEAAAPAARGSSIGEHRAGCGPRCSEDYDTLLSSRR